MIRLNRAPERPNSPPPPWMGWELPLALLVMECYRRIVLGFVPPDFGAYLAAPQVFVQGLDPYTDSIAQSASYQGYPFIYPPAALYLMTPIGHLPPALVTALDSVLRMGCLITSLAILRRYFAMTVSTGMLIWLALLYHPIFVDSFISGNLTTYMMSAVVACVWLSWRAPRALQIVGGVAVGVALCFKPTWLLPGFFVAVSQRCWPLVAGMTAAVTAMTAVSLGDLAFAQSWLARVAAVKAFYFSPNLLELSPVLYVVAALVWGAAGLWLIVKRPHLPIWLYGCTSLAVWPRLGSYCFALMLPVVVYLWRRRGLKFMVLWSLPALGPLPWLLRAADEQWSPDTLLISVYLAWSIATAILLFYEFYRDEPGAHDFAGAGRPDLSGSAIETPRPDQKNCSEPKLNAASPGVTNVQA